MHADENQIPDEGRATISLAESGLKVCPILSAAIPPAAGSSLR
jgi:hypothetical protein